MASMCSIQDLVDLYREHGNHMLVDYLENKFYKDKELQEWRQYFSDHGGLSQDSWFAYWNILIKELNIKNFLDIGVLGGQFSILVKLLAKRHNKNIEVYSVSPFDGTGDLYSTYEQKDYLEVFQQSCKDLNIDFDEFHIYKGLSQDKNIQKELKGIKFQLQYIDGDHTFDGVIEDIEYYVFQLLDRLGVVIFDDSERYLPMGYYNLPSLWQGHEQVINAVHDSMDFNKNFLEMFRVTHNRVFMRKT